MGNSRITVNSTDEEICAVINQEGLNPRKDYVRDRPKPGETHAWIKLDDICLPGDYATLYDRLKGMSKSGTLEIRWFASQPRFRVKAASTQQ